MINSSTNHVLLIIRLLVFTTLFVVSNVLRGVFDKPVELGYFLLLGLFIAVFSIIIFIADRIIRSRYVFFLQVSFDIFIYCYLITKTGFLSSNYIGFYGIIILYVGFIQGIRGGFAALLIFIIISSFYIVYAGSHGNDYYSYYGIILQNSTLFAILLLLASYLHRRFTAQSKEKDIFEQKLDILENIHENIVQNIDIGIILLDETERILTCNKAGRRILNCKHREYFGKTLIEIFPDLILDQMDDLIIKDEKYIGYKFQPFTADKGKYVGKLFIFQDVTEKELMKKELADKQRLADLGQFSAVLAHEIKNPLGAIKGSFQLLKKNPSNIKLLSIIEREVERLEITTGNMLSVARDSKGSGENIDVCVFVKDFVEYVKNFQLFDNVELSVECKSSFDAYISSNELKQVLWNLLVNSFESNEKAEIVFMIDNISGRNMLTFTDNGKGVSKEMKEKLFTPFFSTKRSGTGLGLYTIKTICDKYGIQIIIYDNEEYTHGFKLEMIFSK